MLSEYILLVSKYYLCIFSRGPLQCADENDKIVSSWMEADSDRNELAHAASETCEESDTVTSLIKIVPDKGN